MMIICLSGRRMTNKKENNIFWKEEKVQLEQKTDEKMIYLSVFDIEDTRNTKSLGLSFKTNF